MAASYSSRLCGRVVAISFLNVVDGITQASNPFNSWNGGVLGYIFSKVDIGLWRCVSSNSGTKLLIWLTAFFILLFFTSPQLDVTGWCDFEEQDV